ncbi:MAG: YbfB/YjiJ family MFS transporter [Burkholderiaceae bacterium]
MSTASRGRRFNSPTVTLSDRRLWLIIIGLSIGPAVSNGFARFAYGLILPSMQSDLGWNFSEAGWVNTANAIGYLVGALLALRFVRRIGAGPMFVAGMMLTAIALVGSGMARDLGLLTLCRILAGIGGAPVFIAGGVLASTLFKDDPSRNAMAIAVYFGGGGFGMLLTGLGIPPLLESLGAGAWPHTWMLLGLASALSLLPATWAVSAMPPEPGAADSGERHQLANWRVFPALASYFMFGVGYFVYMTFLVAWMRSQGEGVHLVMATWSVLSIMVMLSPFIWRPVLAASKAGAAITLTLLFTALGTWLPLILDGAPGMLLSAALFGMAFFMVPTAVTNFSKKNYPQSQWGGAVSLFTTVFAVGQMIGPAAAGFVADQTHSLAPGLAAAGLVLVLGAGFALMQKRLSGAD